MDEKKMKDLDPVPANLTPEEEERGLRSLMAALIAQEREEKEFWRRVEEEMKDTSRIEKEIAKFEKWKKRSDEMKFQNEDHELRYHKLLSRMQDLDPYHRVVAYLIALANLVPEDVFDFDEDCIRLSGLHESWQTSSKRKATRLMFNLWSGRIFVDDKDSEDEKISSAAYYSVDDIFSNSEYAPYFYEAVKIKYRITE